MEQQINDIKQHESKLMEKTFEFTSKLAGIEEGMHRLHEHVLTSESQTAERVNALETRLNSRIDTMEHNLFSAISSHVETRAQTQDVHSDGQQKTINKILEVQGRQSEQLDRIQNTLEKFTKIEEEVKLHNVRLKNLEEQQRSEQEIKKEQVKGRWAFIGSIIAAVSAIAVAIITSFVR